MTIRHPGGRTCREALPVAVLLMPYALIRYVRDERKAHAVPVVPGLDGARRPRRGEPGHMERLMSSNPRGRWPLVDRWRDLTR